ncbi:MAG: L,D-transpeptidase [Propionibacteriales bacterium]|nr:L,D-transpeptidase [Propionibacteriales bacterium]
MGKHRAEPPPRVRPRPGRLVAAALALAVTGVALLSGIGVIDLDANPVGPAGAVVRLPATPVGAATAEAEQARPEVAAKQAPVVPAAPVDDNALPAGSGTGRRVVFSMEEQRVWLVNSQNKMLATYLVSGSLTNNLQRGTYDVYSRSRWAVGIDDSGVMQYFVRFTRGKNAPIGFHSIPTKNGDPLQTEKQLGTPQSHGCIRQRLVDAERLWNFAPVGTEVVVV